MIRLILIFATLLAASQSSIGQTRLEKFGRVPIQDIEMTGYLPDPSAEAVILFDKGYLDKQTFKFYRHLRVKILKKSGLNWGNWVFPVPSKSGIKGLVHHLEDGKVITTKLTNEDIFEEDIFENYFVYKVYMPNVRVGSVIEVKYEFTGLPYEWRFQDRIPVVYSEVEIQMPDMIEFNRKAYGNIPINTITPGSHWYAKDVPAFVEEPYSNHYTNFISKMEFEITSFQTDRYRWSWGGTDRFFDLASTWQEVSEELVATRSFWSVPEESMFLNDFAKDMNALNLTFEEKIDTAYHYIKSNIAWNGYETIYTSRYLRDNFKNEHSGSVAEINLSLFSLLKKMEVEVYPIVFSTRSHGILNPISPSLNKLNYVVVLAKDGENELLLDATEKNLQPGDLPERAINGSGRLISEDTTYFVPLIPKNKDKILSMANISIESDNYQFKVQNKYSAYAYLDWLEDYQKAENKANYQSNLEESFGGLDIQDYDFSVDSVHFVCSESIAGSMNNMIDDFGDELIFQPLFFLDLQENPFKNPERKYPVDFVTLKSRQTIATITISDDFEIVSIPKSSRFTLPNNAADFKFYCNLNGENVQIQALMDVKKPIFTEVEYQDLRAYYALVTQKITNAIVLKKKIY
ncbi:MAG: hypothetical protein ACI9A7_000975 [Cyclobacteriaceae bacterium]|jgi:hypothetical protein